MASVADLSIKLGIKADSREGKAALKAIAAQLNALPGDASESSGKMARGFKASFKEIRQSAISTFKIALGNLIASGVQNALQGIKQLTKESVGEFLKFEDVMVGVAKTTGLPKQEIDKLGLSLRDIAADIGPIMATDIGAIAEVAGQLGIASDKIKAGNFAAAREEIEGFSTVIAKATIALPEFSGGAEEIATVIAKQLSLYRANTSEAEAYLSVMNALANTTAANAKQISSFLEGFTIAPQLQMAQWEAAAFASTFVSLGQDANDSATRMQSAIGSILKGTNKTNAAIQDTLQGSANAMGQLETITGRAKKSTESYADYFKQALAKDSTGAIRALIISLGEIEDPVERSKISMEIFGQVGARAMNALIGNTDKLDESLRTAEGAYQSATSIQDEFLTAISTHGAKFEEFKSKVTDVKIEIGQGLATAVADLLETDINPMIDQFRDWLQTSDDAKNFFEVTLPGALNLTVQALQTGGKWLNTFYNRTAKAGTDLGTLIGDIQTGQITIDDFAHALTGITWTDAKEKLSGFVDTVTTKFENIKTTAQEAVQGIVDWFKQLPTRIRNQLASLGETISAPFISAKEAAVEKFQGLVDYVKNVPSQVSGWFKDISLGDWTSATKTKVTGFLNDLKLKPGEITGWFQTMDLGDWTSATKAKVTGFLNDLKLKPGEITGWFQSVDLGDWTSATKTKVTGFLNDLKLKPGEITGWFQTMDLGDWTSATKAKVTGFLNDLKLKPGELTGWFQSVDLGDWTSATKTKVTGFLNDLKLKPGEITGWFQTMDLGDWTSATKAKVTGFLNDLKLKPGELTGWFQSVDLGDWTSATKTKVTGFLNDLKLKPGEITGWFQTMDLGDWTSATKAKVTGFLNDLKLKPGELTGWFQSVDLGDWTTATKTKLSGFLADLKLKPGEITGWFQSVDLGDWTTATKTKLSGFLADLKLKPGEITGWFLAMDLGDWTTTTKETFNSLINLISSELGGLPGQIAGWMQGVKDALTGPFESAVDSTTAALDRYTEVAKKAGIQNEFLTGMFQKVTDKVFGVEDALETHSLTPALKRYVTAALESGEATGQLSEEMKNTCQAVMDADAAYTKIKDSITAKQNEVRRLTVQIREQEIALRTASDGEKDAIRQTITSLRNKQDTVRNSIDLLRIEQSEIKQTLDLETEKVREYQRQAKEQEKLAKEKTEQQNKALEFLQKQAEGQRHATLAVREMNDELDVASKKEDILVNTAEELAETFEDAGDSLSSLGSNFGKLGELFGIKELGGIGDILGGLGGGIDTIMGTVQSLGGIGDAFSGLTGSLGGLGDALGGILGEGGLVNGLFGKLSGLFSGGLSGALSNVTGLLSGGLSSALSSVSGLLSGGLGGALSGVTGMLGGLGGALSGAAGGLGSLAVGAMGALGPIGLVGGAVFGLSKVFKSFFGDSKSEGTKAAESWQKFVNAHITGGEEIKAALKEAKSEFDFTDQLANFSEDATRFYEGLGGFQGLAQGGEFDRFTYAVGMATGNLEKGAQVANQTIDAFGRMGLSIDEMAMRMGEMTAESLGTNAAVEQMAIIEDLLADKSKLTADEIAALETKLNELQGSAQPASTSMHAVHESLGGFSEAWQSGTGALDQFAQAMGKMHGEMEMGPELALNEIETMLRMGMSIDEVATKMGKMTAEAQGTSQALETMRIVESMLANSSSLTASQMTALQAMLAQLTAEAQGLEYELVGASLVPAIDMLSASTDTASTSVNGLKTETQEATSATQTATNSVTALGSSLQQTSVSAATYSGQAQAANQALNQTTVSAGQAGKAMYSLSGALQESGLAGSENARKLGEAMTETGENVTGISTEFEGLNEAISNIPDEKVIKIRVEQDGSIPAMASGGILPGGFALVGERGPELAVYPQGGLAMVGVGGQEIGVFPRHTQIIPNNRVSSFLQQHPDLPRFANGGTVQAAPVINLSVNVTGNTIDKGIDVRRLAEEVSQHIAKTVRPYIRRN